MQSFCLLRYVLYYPSWLLTLTLYFFRSTVHVLFTTHTLANIARTIFPLLENLPAELTELSLTDLPDVNFRVLNAIAQKFCLLQKLELDCTERLDTSCCWDCFEESASCIWHSPIPDMFAGPEDIAVRSKSCAYMGLLTTDYMLLYLDKLKEHSPSSFQARTPSSRHFSLARGHLLRTCLTHPRFL